MKHSTLLDRLPEQLDAERRRANDRAVKCLIEAEPTLVSVGSALERVPFFKPNLILTSGAPLDWADYTGGQRRAVLYGAVYEGLAADLNDADQAISGGKITVASTQNYGCIGSVAGIYTASMPVFVVRDETHGNSAYCNLYEGASRHRLNYGSYNPEVERGLNLLRHILAPVLADVLRRHGPIPLKPIMARALRLGDELHSRNTAATMLFTREITRTLLDLDHAGSSAAIRETLAFLARNDYTFLRLAMAAAKATADAAHGIEFSTVVTGMAINCRDFAIRVSGLGDEWLRGKHPKLEGQFFRGYSDADAEWIGGESCVTETIGLGGFAQVCAPTLQTYQGGTNAAMRQNNEQMYEITLGEHPAYLLPPFDFRGSPVGIDVSLVLKTGIAPMIDGGIAGRDGSQIGAGVLRPSLDCFQRAAERYLDLHPMSGPSPTN